MCEPAMPKDKIGRSTPLEYIYHSFLFLCALGAA